MAGENTNDTTGGETAGGAILRGAAHGSEPSTTPGSPIPRIDATQDGVDSSAHDIAEDAPMGASRTPGPHHAGGVGDGMRTGGSAGTGSGLDPTPAPPMPPARHGDPDEGNHGIGGGRAGGTGP